jgi:hypothetical protein
MRFINNLMMPAHKRGFLKQTARYIGKQMLAVFIIVAVGITFMYFSADGITALCVGVSYLIAISAIIIVIMADDYEHKLKRLLQSGKR